MQTWKVNNFFNPLSEEAVECLEKSGVQVVVAYDAETQGYWTPLAVNLSDGAQADVSISTAAATAAANEFGPAGR